jgi:predicted Zn-ribbon and HTH transcriptional regulator
MKYVSVHFRVLDCLRCGYRWGSRGKELPAHCSRCKSPYWSRPRQVKGVKRVG